MRRLLCLVAFASSAVAFADDVETAPAPRPYIDLTGYHTTKDARRADPKLVRAFNATNVAGFVGVQLAADKSGRAIIEEIVPESPAAQTGLRPGDQIVKIGDTDITTLAAARERLRGVFAKEKFALIVAREGQQIAFAITPVPASKPLANAAGSGPPARAVVGIQGETGKDGGYEVTSVTPDGAGARAGVKTGDIILKIDDTKLEASNGLRDVVSQKRPGDVLKLVVKRGEKELNLDITLQGEQTGGGRGAFGAGGWDDRLPGAWRKNSYRLAIIGVEYPDVKHNPKITDKAWEDSMFSVGTYTDKSATGQKVHGSMADYYKEISYGTFNVEGKFVGWVEVSKKRTEYGTGTGTSNREKTALLTEAMDKLVAKNKDALKDFDGVFFLYAGGRVQTTRGGLYWPHRASVTHGGKRWPYFIVQEGGGDMTNISVFCHEFGHMLGLPDLYARPEVPGMEGVGVWCAMSQQSGGGQPQHFSAWSKDQLGWVKPVAIDPRDKQKLVLSPIEDSPSECFKVILRPDGSEYLLLENRQNKGFDKSLPATGLLIWRVMPGNQTQRVFLEESHGIEGSSGPRQFPASVPFPSSSNNSFTPYTTPSSKSQLGGGFDVHITNIRRLPDGRITFHIGYEYQ